MIFSPKLGIAFMSIF
ncbi:UNVERIFIED_CONTAM: hypothetical protein GTU68_041484 [Idotea baltica]|nr:hypothetical protein [Idotea baltica]